MENTSQLQEQLKLLDELQNIDLEFNRIEQEQQELPKQIEAQKGRMAQLDMEVAARENQIAELLKKRKTLEKELVIEEENISKENAKLMGVKTNKEYHAMQKEIQSKKDAIGEREEKILRIMEEIEDFDRETKRFKQNTEKAKKEILEEITSLEKQQSEIPIRMESTKSARDRHASLIEMPLMETYLELRKKRQGQAVVRVENGVCHGCRLRLPPQLFNMLQRNESVMKCPNCNRILYWMGTPKVHNFDDDGSGS
jgi:uncharacterized protein